MLDPQFGATATPQRITAALDQVDKAVFRARNITEKLLSFVRKSEHRMVPCSLNRLLDDVVGGVKEQEFRVSNIKLVRNYALDLPELMLDPDQMRQVFLNIINNAHDAINGSGKITLTTRHDNGTVSATVTDTGSGMTSERMQKIFMPFFTTKEVGKGTGLGLPISLNIVEAMGGRIEVQSMPGAGSSFTVVFPQAAT
jgi:two-component system NtrC family sensor kinase